MGTPPVARRVRLWSLAALLAASLAGAWLWSRRAGMAAVELPPASSEVARGGPAARAPVAALPPELADGGAARLATPEETARRPTEDPRAENTAPALRVLVRDKDTQVPLSGCDVYFVEEDGEAVREFLWHFDRRGIDLDDVRRIAQHTTSDERGFALLPTPSQSVLALAFDASHIGAGSLEGEEAEAGLLTLDCEPCHFVRAQVVDSSARPRGGVRVLLGEQRPPAGDPGFSARSKSGDGLALLGPIPAEEGDLLFVWPEGVFAPSAVVELARERPPAEPVVVVLPDHGSLEVKLLYADGRPFQAAARVTVSAPSGCPEVLSPPPEPVSMRSGTALFPLVGLNLELQVMAEIDGIEAPAFRRLPGPRHAREAVSVEIRVATGAVSLSGRAVDAAGAPIRFADLELLCLPESGGEHRESEVPTDDVGAWGVTFDARQVPGGRAKVLLGREVDESWSGAVVAVDWTPGTHPLGTLRLTAPEQLASGTVVDALGAAMPGCTIELAHEEQPTEIDFAAPCETDEHGRFELRGWSTRARLQLRAARPGGNPRQVFEVERGAADARVALGP